MLIPSLPRTMLTTEPTSSRLTPSGTPSSKPSGLPVARWKSTASRIASSARTRVVVAGRSSGASV